jgi:glycine oxidase
MDDVLIIGGGVIGLSLAYELSRHGRRVRVVDRAAPGQESSWAGAGILPPAVMRGQGHPFEQLTGLSHALHRQWATRLREETGLDTGYTRCGGLYLAHDEAEADELRQIARSQAECGVEAMWLSPAEVGEREPLLCRERLTGACLFPDECQLRNPRHVKALLVACGNQGVQIQGGTPIDDFLVRHGRIEAALVGDEKLHAEQYCIASGAWSRSILVRLGQQPPIKPIRGQIALLSAPQRVLRHVINDGHRYFVPRLDGRILVGSTEEDVGFDKRTTAAVIGDLLEFAIATVPALADHTVERTWAGLRPGNADGLPYLGRIPDLENAFIAAGHYRHGLHLSTGTAVVMSELMGGEKPQLDLTPFRIDRR